jgi:uncharacterized protein
MIKLSKYIIAVKNFESDSVIIYSTLTGSVIKLQFEEYVLLNQNKYNLLDDLLLKKLINFNILVREEIDETKDLLYRFKNFKPNSYEISIAPSANCQFNCDYCGQEHYNKNLEENNNMKIVKRFENQIKNEQFESSKVVWFGGEPLLNLKSILDLSENFIQICKKYDKSYSSTIVTNGLLLKKRNFDFLKSINVNLIQITIDGNEEAHDNRRIMKRMNGKTFHKIYTNVLEIVKDPEFKHNDTKISIRCNIDYRNSEDVWQLLEKLKFDKIHDKVYFYPAPIHSWANEAHLMSLEKEKYSKLEIEIYSKMIIDGFLLDEEFLPIPISNTCMATNPFYELIDANGNIFDCTEMIYVDEMQIYKTSDLDSMPNKDRFFLDWYDKISNKESKSNCLDCKLLPVCGGGCPKHWLDGINACPSYKENIKERILLEYHSQKNTI